MSEDGSGARLAWLEQGGGGEEGDFEEKYKGERGEKYKQEKKKVKMSRPVSRAASSASAGAAAGVQGLQVHLRFDFFCIPSQNGFL